MVQLDLPQQCLAFNSLHRLVGHSPAMQQVYRTIKRFAQRDTTALLYGETGTGKELAAETIHQLSPRATGPLVRVHCAAISESLLESELFGHVKGAFTGAINSRTGRFEAAQGGTLFLDEIGDIPPAAQVRLLRVLEDKCIERVGCHTPLYIDMRIIAATNKNLTAEVRTGHFRADLFHRLNVVTLTLPPLRERREDIPLLVEHFIHHFNQIFSRQIEGLTPVAMDKLMHYPWPGNVRELRNTIEHAFVQAQGNLIDVDDLPLYLTSSTSPLSPPPSGDRRNWKRRRSERRSSAPGASHVLSLMPSLPRIQGSNLDAATLRSILDQNRWHIGRTAAALKIHCTTLWRYMQWLGLTKGEPAPDR
jgi:two-component system response regulator HydG